MAALKENFAPCDTAVLAINAGADILLDPVELTSQEGIEALETYLDQAEEAVSQGVIPESRIDQSCTRVIELKLKKGLFGQDLTDVEARAEAAMEVIGSPEHHQLEMEITKQSVTLLKNSRHVLPLSLESGETAAFFYPWRDTENSLRYAFDGLVEEEIIPEGAKALYNSMDGHSAEEFADLVSQSKAVIISAETWGESDMDPAQNQRSRFIDEMIELAHSKGKKAVVMSMVLPYDTARYSAADAVLAGYNYKRMAAPAEGEAPTYGPNYLAAVCTVFGGNSPVGRLPVEVYGLDNSYRYTDQVLYPLGSGLLYPDGKLGDFDRDGTVDAADASGILSAYASLLTGDNQALTRQ
ncbi:MAG TPA: glycoside hydrolase family 3 C-terminal domain-containing protein, partial [Ruminococcus sp.]|nr:glycoside hydrolase family 3 C-terminal domain-containing protein [Ruminococcus sp.]